MNVSHCRSPYKILVLWCEKGSIRFQIGSKSSYVDMRSFCIILGGMKTHPKPEFKIIKNWEFPNNHSLCRNQYL